MDNDDSFEAGNNNDFDTMEPVANSPGTLETCENIDGSPKSKSENVEPEEFCSVCRNEMIETTTLSDCVHEFCYDCIVGWLTKGSGQFCPMCKTPVKYIQRKGTDQIVTVEEITALKEPEARASEDLETEKRIVSRKLRSCRRMMNIIDELIAAISRNSKNTNKASRLEELNKCKQLCVSQLNSLQMLRDDINNGAAKALVVSKVAFRRLVYERQVVSDGVSEDYEFPTREEFLADIEHYRSVLHSFLTVELNALPIKTQPRIDKESGWFFYTLNDANRQNEETINRIFALLTEKGVSNLKAKNFDDIFNGLLTQRVINCFIDELKSVIGSGKTYLEWCGAVRYRFRIDVARELNGPAPEVVTVDDTVEEPSSNRTHFYNTIGQLFNQDSAYASTLVNNRASSSDTDHDDDIYFQAPLRLSGPSSSSRLPPLTAPNPTPISGIPWVDLTSPSSLYTYNRIDLRNPGRINLGRIGRIKVGEQHEDDDDIQVLGNETIVLDQSIEEVPGPTTSKTTRKRKSNDILHELIKKTRSELLPDGLADDVQKLMEKYKMNKRNALNMMVDAVQTVIDRSPAKPKSEKNANVTSADQNTSDTLRGNASSSPSAFDNYIARRGIGRWSESLKTKSTSTEI